MKLSEEGRRALSDIAGRYGISDGAVEHLLMALIAGQTTQAQFNHPDLGGMGQWSQGGMIMVGDMFNSGLKAKISDICSELSVLARGLDMQHEPSSFQSQYQGNGGASLFVPGAFSSGNWWPEQLGYAASTGAQNDLRYAFFPASRRLAISVAGRVKVYDTGDHQIGGFSQQQSGDQSLSFTSQYGLVRVADLAVVQLPGQEAEYAPSVGDIAPEPFVAPSPVSQFIPAAQQPALERVDAEPEADIFGKIERLAALHAKGILTDQEYQSKKTDLLNRI